MSDLRVSFKSSFRNELGSQGFVPRPAKYIRDLVRRDYEREEQRKVDWLRHELKAGAEAHEADFIKLDAERLITEAKAQKRDVAAKISALRLSRIVSARISWTQLFSSPLAPCSRESTGYFSPFT